MFILALPLGAMEDFSSLLDQADQAYHHEEFARASEIYEQVLENQHLYLPGVYSNLGNAYYYQGRLPEALWAYEEALQLSPWSRRIAENILIVEMELSLSPVLPGKSILEKWIFWRPLLPPLFWQILLWGSIFGLSLLTAVFILKGKGHRLFSILLIFLSLFFLMPLLADHYVDQHPYGRIISEKTVYSGNGSFYEKVQEFPLPPGQNIRVLEIRRDWAFIEWEAGKKGWIEYSGVLTIGNK